MFARPRMGSPDCGILGDEVVLLQLVLRVRIEVRLTRRDI